MKATLVSLLALFAAVAPAPAFEVYVSDAGNFDNPPWQILRFDDQGENPTVFIGDPLDWPQDILFLDAFGTVLISNLGSGRITRHDAATGAFLSDFATGVGGPTRMKIGPDGAIYVLQWSGNGRVLRYDVDGTFLGEFTTVGVPQSIGIDWDGAGNLYVSSYTADSVRRFDPSGVDLGLFVDSDLVGPTNIWFDEAGDLLVSDYDGGAVRRFDAAGNYLGDFITGLGSPEGVAFFLGGDLLVGNGSDSSVKRFDADGNYLEDFVQSGAGNLLNPNAIVIRGEADVFADGFESGDTSAWSATVP